MHSAIAIDNTARQLSTWRLLALTPTRSFLSRPKKVFAHCHHSRAARLICCADALHATRLLQVEERPFQRLQRSLLGKDTLLKWNPPRQLPSPPPDSTDENVSAEPAALVEQDRRKREKFREDILLDFAALESSILRIQLLHSSNARERERYAAEKAKIVASAQAVRENTLQLRSQLADAQRVLGLRKGYDELAQRLIFEKKLKPRSETMEDIEKLQKEIEDLEHEGSEFEGVWAGRREAWNRVVAEGESLIKVIKGTKDEPDERMGEGEDGEGLDGDGMLSGGKDQRSNVGTPAPGGSTPMPADMGTPMAEGGRTPEPPVNRFLDVDGDATRSSSRMSLPPLRPTEPEDDVDMGLEGAGSMEQQGTSDETTTEERMATEVADVLESEEYAGTPNVEVMDET